MFLMIRRPPRSTRTYTRFPYTTLFRSAVELGDHQPGDAGGGMELAQLRQRVLAGGAVDHHQHFVWRCRVELAEHALDLEIGRASCRERVCPYVLTSAVAVPLKTKNNHTYKYDNVSHNERTLNNRKQKH